MTMDSLDQAKTDLLRAAGAGISLPAAGMLFWLALGTAGYLLDPKAWGLVACFGSGLIFPLGLLLSKPLGSNLFVKDRPLSSLALRAVVSINLLWPLHFAVYFADPQLLPLSLAIGMGLHWPIIGWMYGSNACFQHAFLRVGAASAVWFLYPEGRFTVLPFAVAAAYLVTIVQLKRELAAAQRPGEAEPLRDAI
ncbi:DUF7010 family protein [Lysobacter niastensis]|uniref:Uncharacterized protein n=1 Tax=Lysobacter niastensis TaxID=380629 RepID=A0ABS0B880_9GAMM|nr:hypothetical protein [Lysobacter niastensis]MBF6025226.1 hypothetical protein [Lysobacter niastensis]